MSSAIEFENISKQYRLGLVSTGTLSHDLNRFWQTKVLRRDDPYLKVGETNDRAHKGSSDYVWALKDINFKVEQGDVVGIIGQNGAGKSTLLKLLSRVTAPTTGIIRAKGRIASLLEVGTGFHPEMTGRENIYMNGAIMGMSRNEITRKLDEIVDFSGCERYLDTPVKRYSSGMTVRLGFAIAAHLEPEILVVDEVLAVGDAEFQKKAIGKMQNVSRGEGRTVLFVSHNMDAVKRLCQWGIILKQGKIHFSGNISDVINNYMESIKPRQSKKIIDNIRYSIPGLSITELYFNNSPQAHSTLPNGQTSISISIKGETQEDLIDADLLIVFRKKNGDAVATFAEGHYKDSVKTIPHGKFHITKTIKTPTFISNGLYTIDIVLHNPNKCFYMDASASVSLQIEGGCIPSGRPLILERDGFMGLESISEFQP